MASQLSTVHLHSALLPLTEVQLPEQALTERNAPSQPVPPHQQWKHRSVSLRCCAVLAIASADLNPDRSRSGGGGGGKKNVCTASAPRPIVPAG